MISWKNSLCELVVGTCHSRLAEVGVHGRSKFKIYKKSVSSTGVNNQLVELKEKRSKFARQYHEGILQFVHQ